MAEEAVTPQPVVEPELLSIQNRIAEMMSFADGNSWLQAGIVAVATIIIAYFLTLFLSRILSNIANRTSVDFDDELVRILRPPIFYTLLMFGLMIALGFLPISDEANVRAIAILKSINIMVLMVFFIRFSKLFIRSASNMENKFEFFKIETLPLFENLATVIIIALAIYMIFNTWGIDMTAWLASAGVAGIAIGFAAKDTLANLISGVFILTDTPYKIGDYVILKSGERGEVTDIGIRSTRLLTRDDVELTIPNNVMGNSKVVNESGGPHEKFRFRINITVRYGSDLDLVRAALVEEAKANPNVSSDPEPRVRFRAFEENGMRCQLMAWVDEPYTRGRTVDALIVQVYKRCEKEGIKFAYRQHDVHIRQMPSKSA